jgi:hypothetical protein
VPACGKCNQSKGNKNWKEWMLSAAARSPNQRGISDLAERVVRLEAYERWRQPVCIDYVAMVGPARWSQYRVLLDTAVAHLSEAQKVALELQAIIKSGLANDDLQAAVAKGECIPRFGAKERRGLYREMREVYKDRSKIVHGSHVHKDAEKAAIYLVEGIVPSAGRLARRSLLTSAK